MVVGRKPGHIAVLVLVLVAAAAPNYLAQRAPYSKFGDYSQVADLITSEAKPSDCLNIDDTAYETVEPLTSARPQAYAQLRDYGRLRAAVDANTLYESRLPTWSWAHRLDMCQAVWTISERDATVPNHERGSGLSPGPRLASAPAYQVMRDRGFQIVERWQFNLIQVVESTE
jgi:mannosyltransferase